MTTLQIDLTPRQYHTAELLSDAVARKMGVSVDKIAHINPLRRSLDARRAIVYHTTLEVWLEGEPYAPPVTASRYRRCHDAPPIVIVGAGPAGLFAALRALEVGLRPVIVEQGKPVEQRRTDIAAAARTATVDPTSNWCFGEGGAGTFSDGKLYTRSTKRGDIGYVLRKLVEHGADSDILVDVHAHIGTDRLGAIISRIRDTITQHGGEYRFGTRVTDLYCPTPNVVAGVKDVNGNIHEGIAVVLATGHSSRGIYELFARNGWLIEAKPFAMGVRVEHPQRLINAIQYRLPRNEGEMAFLPPASYSIATQVGSHGVFSFCMCPGGCIVPAATAEGEQVVNGMSNSRRSSPWANSGIAVTIGPADVPCHDDPLALMRFQQQVEQAMFQAAGCRIDAPCQRLTDFCDRRASASLNKSNYLGRCVNAPLHELLPQVIADNLRQAFRQFDSKMHGFLTAEASVLAVESRTSSPVRIPRGDDYQHPQLRHLYPCGEGAGYAGGITSSALDGVNAINAICQYRNYEITL
ncbi:MAG: FAD-binding protein [Bacteroidales bacterium]|nr:FAD-binding protein [Bacteroidales bacterium]